MTRWYELSFPRAMKSASAQAAIEAIVASTPRWAMGPVEATVFETVADRSSIRHRVRSAAPRLMQALTATLPGLRIEEIDEPSLNECRYMRQLVGPRFNQVVEAERAPTVASALLGAIHSLGNDEQIVVQWTTVRTRISGHPDEPKQVTRKRAHQVVVGAGRIGIQAATTGRQRHLSAAVAGAFRVPSGAHGRVTSRRAVFGTPRLERRRTPWIFWPSVINTAELTSLVGWPIEVTDLPGLELGRTRHLPPVDTGTQGPVVGVSTYDQTTQVRLSPSGRTRHNYVLGPTGVGKSTLLANLALQDIFRGHPVVVIDPLGDLIDDIVVRIEPQHRERVMLVDPTDSESPIGLNVLSGRDRHLLVDQVVGTMRNLWRSSWGPRMDDTLRNLLLTLATDRRATLADASRLLIDPTVRLRTTARVSEPTLIEFWEWFENLSNAQRAEVVSPLLNKLRALTVSPAIRQTIAHPDGTLDFDSVFANRRVVLLRLSKGMLGEETSQLIGALLLTKLWQAALGRVRFPKEKRYPAMVYVDEFHDFMRLPAPVGSLLAQARGLGLSMTLAHQHLGQIDTDTRTDVLANALTTVVFRLPGRDARQIAPHFEPYLTGEELAGLGPHEVVARIATSAGPLRPTTLTTKPLGPPLADKQDLAELSTARYGQPLTEDQVEPPEPSPTGRKKIGGSP